MLTEIEVSNSFIIWLCLTFYVKSLLSLSGSCQLLAKEWAQKLPRRLPRNSVARLTDHAQNDLKCVEGARKIPAQQQQQLL